MSAPTRRLAVVQARMASSRLPGKVLMPVLGVPMLLRQIERLKRSREIDRLVVATSTDRSDEPISSACREAGVACARGSLTDVLGRFVQAARTYQPSIVVRLTGDCPLTDPKVVDEVIRFFDGGEYDYVSNIVPPTFPDGLDVEVMRFECLEEAGREAILPSHREHVTVFLRADPKRYRLGNVALSRDLSHLRWTVDEPDDLAFVCRVYERLYPVKPDFTMHDVLRLIEEDPAMDAVNARSNRIETIRKVLQADEDYLAGR